MRKLSNSSIVAPVMAILLGLAAPGMSTSAAAAPFHHGHFGGWHHGWHGGWRHHYGWAPGVGLGVLGGLATGAIIGSLAAPHYYGYGACYQYRNVYDQWGHYLGNRLVDVCG
jgi:hypothetical protein